MGYVNIHEAKTRLSQLIADVESGVESEIVIARNGKPAARLVPVKPANKIPLWGAAKGKWQVPENFDDLDADVAALFNIDAVR